MILIRGLGDVGSAVAHVLYRAGYGVIAHDSPTPSHTRRGMAFTDALFDGKAELGGVLAKRASDATALDLMVRCRRAVPVTAEPLVDILDAVRPAVLVDARMRKHERPETQRGLARLTIGLGPNFETGETADVAIETAWGEDLGRIVWSGKTRDLQGEPQEIAGHARDRYVYAPCSGTFSTSLAIGTEVLADQMVATIGGTPLRAPLSGILRGLTHDGAPVRSGTKVIEVDPRREARFVYGVERRPARIAQGVLETIRVAEGDAKLIDLR